MAEETKSEESGKSGDTTNKTNGSISKEEFDTRLSAALEKHLPEEKPANETEVFGRFIARQITNSMGEKTSDVISLVSLALAGEYQDEKMLTLIEQMPIGGYGY